MGIRRFHRVFDRVLAVGRRATPVLLAVSVVAAACAPGPDVPAAPNTPGGSEVKGRLQVTDALRAGYVAAGLEAAGYILLVSSTDPAPSRDEMRERGSILLSLADRAITTTLSSGLPLDQELYVTAAWNSWRRAQIRFLSGAGGSAAREFGEDTPFEIPHEAVAFGEYMQAAWGDARSHVIAAYIWSSTQTLRELLEAVCGSQRLTSTGDAIASSIAWQERTMRYLAETSAGAAMAEPGWGAPGGDGGRRLTASTVAAGVAAAAVSELRRAEASVGTASSPADTSTSCSPRQPGDEVFESAVSSLASSLRQERSRIGWLEDEIAATLRAIEQGGRQELAASSSAVRGTLASLMGGDAPGAYPSLEAAVSDAADGADPSPTPADPLRADRSVT